MEYTKKNFQLKDKVKFVNTGGNLDGVVGTIVGKSKEYLTDDYIVLFDDVINNQLAVNITEACLERVYK